MMETQVHFTQLELKYIQFDINYVKYTFQFNEEEMMDGGYEGCTVPSYCTVLYCTTPGHGVVDGGHEGEHVRGGVADHVPGQRPPRPELLVPPVNVFHLNIFT